MSKIKVDKRRLFEIIDQLEKLSNALQSIGMGIDGETDPEFGYVEELFYKNFEELKIIAGYKVD